ncbi:MAG: putative RNA methyltransferase [Streptosporangiaceae bacterium]
MLDDAVRFLACSQCGGGLARTDTVLRCLAGHAFDIARQGYVSLLPPGGRAPAGDTARMVAARAEFLAAGHYASLAGELARAARVVITESAASTDVAVPGCVADVGAGPGYYLAAVLDELPDRAGLALDTSRFALRRAARAHPRAGAVAADAWHRLPVADAAAAVVLNVFAPRDGAELRRILHPAGALLVVTPNPGHLAELARPLRLLSVDPRKEERLAGTLGPYFELVRYQSHEAQLWLDHQGIAAAAAMGPSAWHVNAATVAGQIRDLPCRLPVTLSVTLTTFAPRGGILSAEDAGHRGRL